MPQHINYEEIQKELSLHLPKISKNDVDHLTDVFVDIAAGKYVSGKRLVKLHRNQEIQKLFNGNNYLELANKFGISVRHLRRLTKK